MPGEPERQSDPGQGLWGRHANPWSVRTMVAAFPAMVLAIYRRDAPLLAGTLLIVALNPIVLPPATNDRAWATRVVLGERRWLERGLLSSPVDLAFVVLAAPVYLFTLRAAVQRRPVRTAVGTLVSMALMGLFFGRMARLYESERAG